MNLPAPPPELAELCESGAVILPFRGRWPVIAADAFVAPGAAVIGDVEIGPGASVWFGCVIRGDMNVIRVGPGSNIQDGTVVHVTRKTWGTFIGADVTIGHAAVIHGCTLEDGAFVAMKATVMDGCVVESGAMVGAGALLTPGKRVAAGELWLGSPARARRRLEEEERAYFASAAERYAELARVYRRELADG